MNENVRQMDLALNALISVNKNGVENLLRSYNYKVPLFSSGLYNSLISAMAQNSAFTNDILTLLKQASNQPWKYADDGSGDDTASIISGALTGLGMIITTWDNMNVFPTFENYVEQFRIFSEKISAGGSLIYFDGDAEVKKVVLAAPINIRKIPYKVHGYFQNKTGFYAATHNRVVPVKIFGEHN